jgi:hypothetical protein
MEMSIKYFKKCFYAFLILFILTGCRKEYENDVNVLAIEPQSKMISVPTDYVNNSIEAAGGLENWGKIIQLEFDCLVTYYQSDDSFYLTEQHYDIYPWSNSIQISGEEPQGRYICQLSQGQFDILEDNEQIRNSIVNIGNSCLAEAILNIMTIPARLIDNSVVFTRGNAPINIQGELYYPVTRQSRNANQNSVNESDAVFYQDTNNYLVDMIWLICQNGKNFVLVRGHDYIKIKNSDIFIPSKIEIFKTDVQGMSKDKLVKIEVNST